MEKWSPDWGSTYKLIIVIVVVLVGRWVSLGQIPKETVGKFKLSPHGWSGQVSGWQN